MLTNAPENPYQFVDFGEKITLEQAESLLDAPNLPDGTDISTICDSSLATLAELFAKELGLESSTATAQQVMDYWNGLTDMYRDSVLRERAIVANLRRILMPTGRNVRLTTWNQ